MDRLTSLTAFVQVVDSGGFSAAGRRLNVSTTMVSNHIQALEDRLGARLLNRTTRKVSLTEVGKAYYDSLATWRHVLCCSPGYIEQHGPLRQSAPSWSKYWQCSRNNE
jgi:DNA-binding transcriptional LysR family regulator